MPNNKGSKYKYRLILSTVITSVILYGTPIWANVYKKSYLNKIKSVYRLYALRVACAYRTVSYDAACVIAGMVPIQILISERKELYKKFQENEHISKNERKKDARHESMLQWKQQWDISEKGRWTYRLITNLETWVNRKHGEVDFYMPLFLSGHGCFRSYLYKFKLDNTPECPTCVNNIEDAEHVIFNCSRFEILRKELFKDIGMPITVDNIITIILESETKWKIFNKYVTKIMLELREIDTNRRSQTIP